MTKNFTKIFLFFLLAIPLLISNANAQDRTDILWARDIGAEEITLDGALDEAVWDQAEEVQLIWGERVGFPGSGWRFHGNFTLAEPSDPINANIKILRKGDQLYVGASMDDKSVGGATGLWNIDGLVMAIMNPGNYVMNANTDSRNLFPGAGTGEYILSWWHQADTTAAGLPTPATEPRFHGLFGSPNNEASKERSAESIAAWDAVTVVDGTANDDTHGDDVGYVVEMRVDLAALGYEPDAADGAEIPASITVYDSDYQWPVDQNLFTTTKVWLESQWGNNLNEGAVRIKTHPGVTVDTAVLPDSSPDFLIQNGDAMDAPAVDGNLDDSIWQSFSPQVEFGYQQVDVNQNLPGYGGTYTFWFRPDLNGMDPDPPVIDPSIVRFKFFYRGDDLFIGAEVDDQAVSGKAGEAGDGFSITINHQDSLDGDNTMWQARYIFDVDSTGTVRMGGEAAALQLANPSAIEASASLRGASTAGDPTDVDEGYQIEIRLNLVDALGYEAGLTGNRWVWLGANLFDADDLEDPANSYTTRTWWLRERNTGPGAFAYLDESAVGIAIEDDNELPRDIRLDGNYPNPFNPVTTLRYALPSAGEVTLNVFDILGRQVSSTNIGQLGAGSYEFNFDAKDLASGVYLYRIVLANQATGDQQLSKVGRMMLLK